MLSKGNTNKREIKEEKKNNHIKKEKKKTREHKSGSMITKMN